MRIDAGRVVAVAPHLERLSDEDVLPASGTVVLPGLHDHHLHLRALVAAGRSVRVGPHDVRGLAGLGEALRRAPADDHGWRRAVGYHESVAGELDRWTLDALLADAPVRVQHRSGSLWVVNSAAVTVLGLEDLDLTGVERDIARRPTGRLWRMDDWLGRRLSDVDPLANVAETSRWLSARGVTGVTEATPDASPSTLSALVDAAHEGRLLQRVHVMCPAGVEPPAQPLVSRGPHKVMLDDDRLPSLGELVDLVARAHGCAVPVAVHCVTPTQLALTVAALQAAGAMSGDRIEHGAVVHPDVAGVLASLGVAVVTNPGLIHERGDRYLEDIDPRDLDHLYPCASLVASGVDVAAGSDAPFGPADPWTAIWAARTRQTAGGRVVGEHEALSLSAALSLFGGQASSPATPRRVAAGEPADLIFLTGGAVPDPGQPDGVAATVVAGRVVHRAG